MLSRLGAFLNSSLGIWFLSSVVLSGISFGYGKYTSALEAERSQQVAVQRAKLEVRQRLVQVVAHYRRHKASAKASDPPDVTFLRQLDEILVRPPSTQSNATSLLVFAAYPEFKDRPMLSLLLELYTLETSDSSKASVRTLYMLVNEIMDGSLAVQATDQRSKKFESIRKDPYWAVPS